MVEQRRRYTPMLDGYPGREKAEELEADKRLRDGAEAVLRDLKPPTRLHSTQGTVDGAPCTVRGNNQ